MKKTDFREQVARAIAEGAGIEVPEADIAALVDTEIRAQIVSRFRELGYAYVALDLAGFFSGSMNAVL